MWQPSTKDQPQQPFSGISMFFGMATDEQLLNKLWEVIRKELAWIS